MGILLDYQKKKDIKEAYEELENELENYDNLEQFEDCINDFIDRRIEPYTKNLLDWYSEDIDRVYYMQEFLDDFGENKDIFKILSGGQYMYWNEVYQEAFERIKEEIRGKRA